VPASHGQFGDGFLEFTFLFGISSFFALPFISSAAELLTDPNVPATFTE
jgi:hypothetical protein